MPLRDHFRSPLNDHFNWEGVHGSWPTFMIQNLNQKLPQEFVAEPRVHLGSNFEVVIGTFETNRPYAARSQEEVASEVTVSWTPATAVLTVETDFPEPSEYEVLIYDISRARRLVAAVEIVSPANKDRPEHRRAFVAKCAGMLQQQVCVSIVDIVTIRRFNLYAQLMELIDRPDPEFGASPPELYAVTCRGRRTERRTYLDACRVVLALGQSLPTLPIWLREDLAIPLDLETSYEETCRMLRIS